jgi:hypothetical protein
MDQIPLVEEQIKDGQRLVEQLRQHDFPVTASFWARGSEDGQWSLYLVSPVVDEDGIRKAYRRLHPVFWGMPPPFSVEALQVTLLSPKEPVARAIAEIQRQSKGKRSPHYGYGGARLGDLSIDGAYIYPPLEPVM